LAILATFLRPVFSASRVQHVSDLHLKLALRPHHVWKYGRIQPATAEIRRGKRRRRRKKKPQDKNIMVCSIPYGDHKYRRLLQLATYTNLSDALSAQFLQ